MKGETPLDTPLQPQLQEKWKRLVVELVAMNAVRICRTFRPQRASWPGDLVDFQVDPLHHTPGPENIFDMGTSRCRARL